MTASKLKIGAALLVALTTLIAANACSGSYDSNAPTAPSPSGGTVGATPSGGTVGATVTLTAGGLSEATPRIALGQRVRFTNNDSRPHQIFSTPHNLHTDCPALNEIGMLLPGESRDSGVLNVRRGCGFHDHLNPDDQRFRGQVLVGLSETDPVPPPPEY